MNLPLFLARRFFKGSGEANQKMASSPAIRVATLGIAVGLAVMLITQSVVSGFQKEVQRKIEGFASDIEVTNPQSYASPESHAIDATPNFLKQIKANPVVESATCVATKMGILKTETDFLSVQIKGLPEDYDTTFLASCLFEGRMPHFSADESSNDILLSRRQANDLNLKVGDRVFAYFFEEDIRMRRFTVAGIYETNMSLFDRNVVVASFSTVASLNQWSNVPMVHPCTMVEVRLHSLDNLTGEAVKVAKLIQQEGIEGATPISVREHYPQVFSWLDLLDFNMLVILILMVCVAGFTMVSGLFILILERAQTIGVLKALGATNRRIRHTFLYFAAMIIVRGMLLGDILALVLLGAQRAWGFVHLDPQTYYVDTVPVAFDLWPLVLINIGTLLITILALVGPSYMISRIQPAKAIRFE